MSPAVAMDHRPNEAAVPSLSDASTTSNGNVEVGDGIDDALVQDFLAQSGLDTSSIDPASLEALKELLGSSVQSASSSSNDKNIDVHDTNDFCRETTTHNYGTLTTTTTSTNGSHRPQRDPVREEELLNATAVEKRILDQLELQLGLLTDMKHQLETLTDKVHQLQHAVGANPNNSNNNTTAPPIRDRQGQWQMPTRPAVQRGDVRRDNAAPPQPVVQGEPLPPNVPPRRPPRAAIWFNPWTLVMSIVNMLYESRLSKIVRLFWRMQRQQVQDFDGGLLFKVLVIVAILTARWSSNKRKKQTNNNNNSGGGVNPSPSLAQFWDAYRFYIMILLVGVGFLAQSGYLQFLYNFFIKENYPVRIWCGEDVDMEAPGHPAGPHAPLRPPNRQGAGQPPQQQPQQLQQQPPAPGGVPGVGGRGVGGANLPFDWNQVWRDGVLRFMVGPPAPQEPVNDNVLVQIGRMVVKTLIDFVCLIGSFVLSIFPMVNLEDLRVPPPPTEQPDNNHEDQAVPPPARDAPAAAHGAHDGRNEPAPGAVRPPRDPAEPLDE